MSEVELTKSQRHFLNCVQDALIDIGKPVTIVDILQNYDKSESRVRSHINDLLNIGYLVRVGDSRTKTYILGAWWYDEPDYIECDLDGDLIRPGGRCATESCENMAEDVYHGKYLCRRCIIGTDEEEDIKNLRNRWHEDMAPSSSGGSLLGVEKG